MEFRLDRALKIDGWMSEAELQFLAETASKSNLIYEIGSYLGRSTRALADNTRGLVHAIDPWNIDNYDGLGNAMIFTSDTANFNHFYCNLADLIDKELVIPQCCTWEDFDPPAKADFIFIDGDHRYESVKRDINKAMRWIAPEGVIAGHDYNAYWPGVVKAANETFGKVNVVDTIWWVRMR